MILVKLQIYLMVFNSPIENIRDDILYNKKRLHSKMVKFMCSSGRVTITFFFSCGLSFTVRRTNVGRVIAVESSPLHLASCSGRARY